MPNASNSTQIDHEMPKEAHTAIFQAHNSKVTVTTWPEGSDGSVEVYAHGCAVDAVYACPFGGFRPYSRGKPMHPGQMACESVPIAIQQALNS